MKRPPLKIFFCYAHEDAAMRHALDFHLDMLEREGLVVSWYDGRIAPGTEWSESIQQNLRAADLIVFLVSQAFLRSTYIAEVEMRLALERHREGAARVIPVLLHKIPVFSELPFAKLESLPSKARPISQWRDRVAALDDVIAGIRRAAVSLIIESGGPFEFGSHHFTEAELAGLTRPARTRAMAGLRRLRTQLGETVPPRRLDCNLLVATWCMNQLGRRAQLPESTFYTAQVISAFDVVSLQEIDRNMEALERLIAVLGPEWGYLISDVTEGVVGNMERCAILHYTPRVVFEHISGDVVLPEPLLVNGKQFARKPLLASFRAADFRFRMTAAHIYFGGGGSDARRQGLEECRTLARFLSRVAARDRESIVLAGNFNTATRDSPAIQAFRQQGFSLPFRTLHPSHLLTEKYYNLVGFLLSPDADAPTARIRASGVVNPYESVFREADFSTYEAAVLQRKRDHAVGGAGPDPRRRYSRFWRTEQLSDHLPVWVELELKKTRKASHPKAG